MRVVHNIKTDRFAIENVTAGEIENLLYIIKSLDCRDCECFNWCKDYECCSAWGSPLEKAFSDRNTRKDAVILDGNKGNGKDEND